jgi:F-type H+-transporting ATPase subunit b
MLIDWFTVFAQGVNFLVLIWLLKRFLYKPVLAAIAAREKSIIDQLKNAEQKKSAAQTERDAFQQKNEEFDRQRAALLAHAINDGQA